MSTSYHPHGNMSGAHNVPFAGVVAPMNHFGEVVYAAFAAVWREARATAYEVHMYFRERRTAQVLSNLDDRTLMDIGVHRGEIRDLAKRAARARGFDYHAYLRG